VRCSDSRHRKYRFPDGEIPDKSKESLGKYSSGFGDFVRPDRVLSGLAIARSDFPIRQREIIRESILWVQKSPDKGFEEHFSSSGRGKRRSW
jgi:hypothetical protein